MKKLNINENTKIYVACPANFATGGPELLHQLVHYLNNLGFNAYMYYFNQKPNENPIHPAYKEYNNAYVEEIEDNKNNILIVPEVKTDLIYNYKYIQKVIWWLSVDNFYNFLGRNPIKKSIKYFLWKMGVYKIYNFNEKDKVIHFVQSEYARQYLIKKGINDIYFLGDYLNKYFIIQQTNNINKRKKNIVIYNPKKGFGFTQKIIKFAKDIKFIPIQNMTREEVADLLSSAKVYIDFGNHPGKDRIPREAAISGCCVITGKKGSAKYYEDVPIPEKYKFEDKEENIPQIVEKIRYCIDNYDEVKKDFNNYRSLIKNEEEKFIEDIKKIFNINKG